MLELLCHGCSFPHRVQVSFLGFGFSLLGKKTNLPSLPSYTQRFTSPKSKEAIGKNLCYILSTEPIKVIPRKANDFMDAYAKWTTQFFYLHPNRQEVSDPPWILDFLGCGSVDRLLRNPIHPTEDPDG